MLKHTTQDSINTEFIQLLLKVYIFIQYISAVTVIKYTEQTQLSINTIKQFSLKTKIL